CGRIRPGVVSGRPDLAPADRSARRWPEPPPTAWYGACGAHALQIPGAPTAAPLRGNPWQALPASAPAWSLLPVRREERGGAPGRRAIGPVGLDAPTGTGHAVREVQC